MPNRSYQKGYRFEKKVQAWLAHLGFVERSVGSRGKDLWITRYLRRWSVSCKCRKKTNPITMKMLKEQLESNDFFVWEETRGTTYFAGVLSKTVEFCGGEKLE